MKIIMYPRQLVRRYFQYVISVAAFLIIVFSYYYLPWIIAIDINFSEFSSSRNFFSDKVIIRNRSSSEINQTSKSNINFIPGKPWYYANGTMFPRKTNSTHKLYPSDDPGDRILEQLMYIPENYSSKKHNNHITKQDSPVKVLLAYSGLKKWDPTPETAFVGCPVNKCMLTIDKKQAVDADALMFRDPFQYPDIVRPKNQIWFLYNREPPHLTHVIKKEFRNVFNWTATYRKDSTLSIPNYRWIYYDPEIREKPQTINYAANKTKKVAWFVSNCRAKNQRQNYAHELSKYIPVDIYGRCGNLNCPQSEETCFSMLQRDYKFYLAFENSNCRDYITEKLYFNALKHNVLPIVMGAHPKDYERDAPQGSYIHVDEFAGPKELASYLHRLDQDDQLYNKYFKWKGTGELLDPYTWCRFCTMMHAPLKYEYIEDYEKWWRRDGICTDSAWQNP